MGKKNVLDLYHVSMNGRWFRCGCVRNCPLLLRLRVIDAFIIFLCKIHKALTICQFAIICTVAGFTSCQLLPNNESFVLHFHRYVNFISFYVFNFFALLAPNLPSRRYVFFPINKSTQIADLTFSSFIGLIRPYHTISSSLCSLCRRTVLCLLRHWKCVNEYKMSAAYKLMESFVKIHSLRWQ